MKKDYLLVTFVTAVVAYLVYSFIGSLLVEVSQKTAELIR